MLTGSNDFDWELFRITVNIGDTSVDGDDDIEKHSEASGGIAGIGNGDDDDRDDGHDDDIWTLGCAYERNTDSRKTNR